MSEADNNTSSKKPNLLVIILVLIGIGLAGFGVYSLTKNKSNNSGVLGTQGARTGYSDVVPLNPTEDKTFTTASNLNLCKEDNKPVVYLFSTTTCPHCKWVKNTFDKVASEYAKKGKIVAYHWELDTGDNTLTSAVETNVPSQDQAVFTRFDSEGYVPLFVIGCKYYRIGNGYESTGDLKKEEAELREFIDKVVSEK